MSGDTNVEQWGCGCQDVAALADGAAGHNYSLLLGAAEGSQEAMPGHLSPGKLSPSS